MRSAKSSSHHGDGNPGTTLAADRWNARCVLWSGWKGNNRCAAYPRHLGTRVATAVKEWSGSEKIWVIGDRFQVARYHLDGSLDTSFGVNGTFVPALREARSSDFAIASDGSIIVVGTTHSVAWVRFSPSKTHRFRSNRFLLWTEWDRYDRLRWPGRQCLSRGNPRRWLPPRRRQFHASHNLSLRRRPSHVLGVIDSTFGDVGDNGKQVISFGNGINETASSLAIQPDGKILIAGNSFQDSLEGHVSAVARLSSDGVLDPGFGIGGQSTVNIYGGNAFGVLFEKRLATWP